MKATSEHIDWAGGPPCNGVILHEDPATELRAMKLWSQIAEGMGPEITCDLTPWPLALFEAPRLRERAFRDAEQTDVVTISVHDVARLSADVSKWLTQWLNTKSSLPRALIILHDGEEQNEVVTFLKMLAEFVGVSVFSRGGEIANGSDAIGATHYRQREESLAFAP
ncbi:MAG: hypothetical protein FJ388_24150 [Verrucomicrobia bacterium]|nr:hypothetical protein [Verrucomicrobiota bacterium]